MLATATTEVAAKRGKREFLTISIRRSRGGVMVRAKSAPELEAYFRDLSRPTPEGEPRTLSSTRANWSAYQYYALPDGVRIMLTDDQDNRAATIDTVGSQDLGRPDDAYNYPLNASWLRAVGLSEHGVELEFPSTVWTPDLARRYVTQVGNAVKRLYRDRLQPFDITVVITVDEYVG